MVAAVAITCLLGELVRHPIPKDVLYGDLRFDSSAQGAALAFFSRHHPCRVTACPARPPAPVRRVGGSAGHSYSRFSAVNHYDVPMPRAGQRALFYGHPTDHEPLAWSWVEAELVRSGTYWVVARSSGHPHPRPVWGIWHEDLLYLSIGTPAIQQALADDPVITAHLESGTDVVIVEGEVTGSTIDVNIVVAYDEKYDWSYDVAEYGPLVVVAPSKILAWQAVGWAGRESFQRSGMWKSSG